MMRQRPAHKMEALVPLVNGKENGLRRISPTLEVSQESSPCSGQLQRLCAPSLPTRAPSLPTRTLRPLCRATFFRVPHSDTATHLKGHLLAPLRPFLSKMAGALFPVWGRGVRKRGNTVLGIIPMRWEKTPASIGEYFGCRRRTNALLLLVIVLCCCHRTAPAAATTATQGISDEESLASRPDPARPFVSVVMGGRNDDWGGNFTARLGRCLSAIAASATSRQLHMEVIIVDYNPPKGAAPISELGIPRMTPPSTTKVLVVSPKIHLELSQTVTWRDYGAHLFEYVAKNVGLRAARGEFVLFTNPDIILSPAFFTWLASGNLSPSTFYTLPRTDLPALPPEGLASGDQTDEWCKATGARHGRGLAPGDFLLAARSVWHELGGFPETGSNAGVDTIALAAMRAMGLQEEQLGGEIHAYHQPHDVSAGGRGRAAREQREMRSGRNTHAESALLARMMRVLGQRVVWAKRGAGGWGLGGVEEAPNRGYCEGETCRASRCASKLINTASVECTAAAADLKGGGSLPNNRTDTCHRAGCCVAYHLLGGSSESARLAAQDLFSLAMSSCPEQLTGALSAAVGAMEHLSLFPEEALAAYRTAARLDPARWGRERSKAECFARVFKASQAQISQTDVRESYGRMESAMLERCGGSEMNLPLESLCPLRLL